MAAARRESRPHACAICRQPALAGDRLCAPCRSALKRARDSTVSDAMMPARRPRRRAAAAVPAETGADANVAATPVSRARWLARGIGLSMLGATLVAGGVWIAHTRGIAGTIAPRYSVAPQETSAETIEAAAAARPAPAAPVAADRTPSAGRDDAASTRTIDARALPASITMPRGRAETDALAATAASTAATPAPAPVVDPPLPPPVVVAQAPARAAPDRWQRLAEQIEGCPPDTLKRAVCQESLRIEYCEGHWGRVAACPAKVEREYGN
jgi:hypothetical protein